MEVSLQEYIDIRIKSIERQIEDLSRFTAQHFELSERANEKAKEVMEIRLEGMNEFRSQIDKERTSYATKEMVEREVRLAGARIKRLEMSNSFSSGRMWMAMAGFAIVPTIISLIAFIRSL